MSNSLSFCRRFVSNVFSLVLVLLVLSACGQKGDLYLPNIPPSPNVMSDGQENDQDESSETKKDKNVTESKESLPASVAE